MMGKLPKKTLLYMALALALALLLGSCSNYKYYNRYPTPRKCGTCPSFSHRMDLPQLT